MIRLLIAEDQALIRGALAALLAREPDIEVVAQVERGDAVLGEALKTRPDVAMLDIEMPGLDGIAAAAELRQNLRRAMESGAAGFLLKDARPEELASAVRRTAAGERVIDPHLAAAALAEGASPLTPRERDVLALSVRRAGVEEVAQALHLSRGTVRNHLSIAIQKLHADNRLQAARIAEEKGWL